MKHILLPLLLLMALVVRAQELPGVVGIFKMDENCGLIDAFDTDPSNGALIDVALTPNRFGTANAALSFAASTSYATLGVVPRLQLADDKSFTFSIRPVPTNSNITGSIFLYGNGIVIRYIETVSPAEVKLEALFGGVSYFTLKLTPNQWQNIAITFRKNFSGAESQAAGYVGGALVVQGNRAKTSASFTNSLAMLGPRDQSTLTNGFRGALDDLRIYTRVLSLSEVQNIALPAKLEFFKGEYAKGIVELSWKTSMKENLSHFNVQKSADGTNFTTISRIEAGVGSYVAYDTVAAAPASASYRLQIVDKDQQFKYSDVISVSFEDTTTPDTSSIAVYPNPGSRVINIRGTGNGAKIIIVNNAGSIVKKEVHSTASPISITALRPGLYYIRIEDGEKKKVIKFIKR